MIQKNGWIHIRTKGSHYIYEKDGMTYPVAYHGSDEIATGMEKKIKKVMKLK